MEENEKRTEEAKRSSLISAALFLFFGVSLILLLLTVYFSTPPLRLVSVSYASEKSDASSMIPSVSSSLSSQSGPHTVCINKADALEMAEYLPGIGETLAERIVSYREEHGLFQAPEELLEVEGIGEKKLEAILPYITLDP